MSLQNRVGPDGAITDAGFRGHMMGNRGILHDAEGRLGRARWRHPNWVACRLAFKGRRRRVMSPGRYTELFFWDEAVALAAGHRPCAECRRADYLAFRRALAATRPEVAGLAAAQLDRLLHRDRLEGRAQRRLPLPAAEVPEGAFLHWQGAAWLLWQAEVHRYAPGGYAEARPRAALPAEVLVMTPALTLDALRGGYRPEVALTPPV